VIINKSDTHFPNISLPPTPTVDSSYQYGPKPWIDQFPVLDSAVILVVGIIGLTFLTLMIVLLQFMIFGTRKKERSDDDEVDETSGDDVVGGGGRRGRGRGRRRRKGRADSGQCHLMTWTSLKRSVRNCAILISLLILPN